MLIRSVLVLLVVAVVGCGSSEDNGSGSGVSSSKKISELSDAELKTVCSWSIELRGGENKVTDCPGGGKLDTSTIAECVKLLGESGCTATVSETEKCVEAMAPKPCESPMDLPACDQVTPCFTSSDDLPQTTSSK